MGLRTIVNRETEKLLKVVTRVPVTTGATLRRLLQVRAVRHVQKELGNYFNNNLVLFLSGMRNYEIAVALSDYTKNLSFADPVFQAGSPLLLGSLAQLELYAHGNELVAGQKPFRLLERSLSGLKNMRVANAMASAHLIVGTFGEIKAVGTVANLEGKTLITSAVHDDQLAFYKQCKVNLVIDVTPNLFGRVVGVATLEAMILAHLGRNANELADDEFEEIITELDIKPRLLHPTGKFRNIRRFAFVVHPLSQEFIKKGFPIPKATPKIVMDKVEHAGRLHPAAGVLQDGEHRLAHRGRGRRLAALRRRHAEGDAVAQPRVHLPPAAGRGRRWPRRWARRSWAWAPSPRWWAMPASPWRGAPPSPSPPATAIRPRARCGPRPTR